MKRFITLTFVALLFTAITVNSALAAYPGDRHSSHRGEPMLALLMKLNLSSEQKQQVKDVFKKHRAQIQPIFKQEITERRVLRNLVQSETVDEQAIRGESAKIATLNADMAVQRASLFHDIRSILTPDQIQKFKELQTKWDQKVDKRMARHEKEQL